MKCKKCGTELTEVHKFCYVCGEPNNDTDFFEEDEADDLPVEEKPKKTKKSKIIIACCLSAALLIVGGVLLAKMLLDPNKRMMDAINSSDYGEAAEVFAQHSDEIDMDELVIKLSERMMQLLNDYNMGAVTYEYAKAEIGNIFSLNVSQLESVILETETSIEALKVSKAAFDSAEGFLNNGDFVSAISEYEKVIENDSNYTSAQEKIEISYNGYRNAALAAAEQYALSSDYDKAIETLQEALKFMKDDETLTGKMTEYVAKKTEKIETELLASAKAKADDGLYEDAIKLLREYIKNNENASPIIAETLTEYENSYVDSVIAKVDELIKKAKDELNTKYFDEAVTLLNEANSFVESKKFTDKIASIKNLRPVSLKDLKAFTGGFEWGKGDATDPKGNVYTNAINYVVFDNGRDAVKQYKAEYELNSKYSKLTGTIVPQEDMSSDGYAFVEIYVNDDVVYTSKTIKDETGAFKFSIDVSNAVYVRIEVRCGEKSHLILSDVLLWKK